MRIVSRSRRTRSHRTPEDPGVQRLLSRHRGRVRSCDSSTPRPLRVRACSGRSRPHAARARSVEFNDLPALAEALSHRDVACVITEPGDDELVHGAAEPDFHAGLRRLTRETGTLLPDSTRRTRFSTGPGGYTRAYGLEPGPTSSSVSRLRWCPRQRVGFPRTMWRAGWDEARKATPPGHSGMGTTLSANALALAAMRADARARHDAEAYEAHGAPRRPAGSRAAGLGFEAPPAVARRPGRRPRRIHLRTRPAPPTALKPRRRMPAGSASARCTWRC